MYSGKRNEIAFEISRAIIFGSHWRDHTAWCSECESYVPIVSAFTVATMIKTNVAEIFRRAEKGELHYKVSDDGNLLICFSSIFDEKGELRKEIVTLTQSKLLRTDFFNYACSFN